MAAGVDDRYCVGTDMVSPGAGSLRRMTKTPDVPPLLAYLASDSTVHLPAPIMIVAVPSFMIVPANVKFLLSRSNS
jgi:hypothetical protein